MERAVRDAFGEFTSSLTDVQKAAVAEFLQVFEPVFEEEDLENTVRTALDRYWRQFLPPK